MTVQTARRIPPASVTPPRRPARLVGLVVSVLVAAFLLFDAALHLLNPPVVQQGSVQLGFDPAVPLFMGAVELAFVACYLFRPTAVLGAVLLTAYLGGAFTAQLRIDAPLFSTLLFPVYVAVAVWGGLWLRDARLRALVPFRRTVG